MKCFVLDDSCSTARRWRSRLNGAGQGGQTSFVRGVPFSSLPTFNAHALLLQLLRYGMAELSYTNVNMLLSWLVTSLNLTWPARVGVFFRYVFCAQGGGRRRGCPLGGDAAAGDDPQGRGDVEAPLRNLGALHSPAAARALAAGIYINTQAYIFFAVLVFCS